MSEAPYYIINLEKKDLSKLLEINNIIYFGLVNRRPFKVSEIIEQQFINHRKTYCL